MTKKRTLWYSGNTHPTRVGDYERLFTDGVYLNYWSGKRWHFYKGGGQHWRQVGSYPWWRGLARKP